MGRALLDACTPKTVRAVASAAEQVEHWRILKTTVSFE